MARKMKSRVNKSEEVRKQLEANPEMKAKVVVEELAKKNIEITDSLVYYIKREMSGKNGRRKKAPQMAAKVATTGNPDPVQAILKVKALATDLGGLKKLKALVEVLSE